MVHENIKKILAAGFCYSPTGMNCKAQLGHNDMHIKRGPPRGTFES